MSRGFRIQTPGSKTRLPLKNCSTSRKTLLSFRTSTFSADKDKLFPASLTGVGLLQDHEQMSVLHHSALPRFCSEELEEHCKRGAVDRKWRGAPWASGTAVPCQGQRVLHAHGLPAPRSGALLCDSGTATIGSIHQVVKVQSPRTYSRSWKQTVGQKSAP